MFKYITGLVASIGLAGALSAQTTLLDFSDSSSFLASGTSASSSVAGTVTFTGSFTDTWYFALPSTSDLSSIVSKNINLTGFSGSGNNSGVKFVFLDESAAELGVVEFSGLTTSSSTLTSTVNVFSSLAAVAYIQVAGDGSPSSVYNFTLDSLTVVPEPSTVALGLGAAALGAAVVIRRRKTA